MARFRFVKGADKIQAIKAIVHFSGLGLRDSKALVDAGTSFALPASRDDVMGHFESIKDRYPQAIWPPLEAVEHGMETPASVSELRQQYLAAVAGISSDERRRDEVATVIPLLLEYI